MAVTEQSAGGVQINNIAEDTPDWRDIAPGIRVRVLRTCQATGTWAVLYKVDAGTSASSHVHFGSADSYVISGKMETLGGVEKGGKTLVGGDYAFEPNSNRRHSATYFAEDTLLLYIHQGPLMYVDDDGNCKAIADFNAMRQLALAPAA